MAYSSSSSPNLKPGAASPFHGGTSPNPNQNHNPNPSPGRGCQPLEFLPLRPTSVRAVPSPDGYCTYPWEPCRRAKSEWVSGGGIDVNRIPQDCHESSSPHSVLSSGPSSAFLKRDRGSKRERVREREGEREKTSESSDQEQRGGWEISSQGVGGRGGGGGSDEDEGVGGGSSSRKKLRLSKEQSALLEKSFRDQSTLNTKQKNTLAAHLNLTPRQVEVWFQNRRARTKLKQTEIDCEFLRRRYESLTEQNRRLQREVQELRAIKVAPPCIIAHDYYMPMPMPVPAATLTVCPSCQRLATMDNNRTLGLPRQQPPPSATC